ncbi:single-stranded DNA-binding protein [Corynebacterium sp. MNWGS58]|uniref:single-stranded DNA-binding protein n=1 Tax=Corynebacterium sp. 102791.4 TaxID=3104612 RepID=UPI003518C7EF
MSQHQITITGRITQDPRLRRVAGGNCVLDMRLASSRAVRDTEQESGWRDYDNLFIDVETWGQLAINAAMSLHKGYPVVVVGSLVTQEWEDAEDNRRSKTVLKASHIAPDLTHHAAALTTRKADRDASGAPVLNVEDVVFDHDALADAATGTGAGAGTAGGAGAAGNTGNKDGSANTGGFSDESAIAFGEQRVEPVGAK